MLALLTGTVRQEQSITVSASEDSLVAAPQQKPAAAFLA
jgi:hypothetical protein